MVRQHAEYVLNNACNVLLLNHRVQRTPAMCYSAPTYIQFSKNQSKVSKQPVEVSVSTRRECCQECLRVIPCQINQWFASHSSDLDEIWHTCR